LAGGSGRLCASEPVPQPRAHAHNDYEHTRPLLDALDQGFCSVEADIHLVNGVLLVGHDPGDVTPERTLEALYLRPLLERTRRFDGFVYPGKVRFTLLVDIKTAAGETYAALRPLLERYAGMLTTYRDGHEVPGAVTVILSGNRPRALVETEMVRHVAIDGRISDLTTNPPAALVPLISDNWSLQFAWRGQGDLPEAQKAKLDQLVRQAHDQGRRIRFWAVPDKPEAWGVLYRAGVDLLNTDDLPGLAVFLQGQTK